MGAGVPSASCRRDPLGGALVPSARTGQAAADPVLLRGAQWTLSARLPANPVLLGHPATARVLGRGGDRRTRGSEDTGIGGPGAWRQGSCGRPACVPGRPRVRSPGAARTAQHVLPRFSDGRGSRWSSVGDAACSVGAQETACGLVLGLAVGPKQLGRRR